uniref:Ribonuclease H protein n=1 Tax=Steinernema glaseri TaxID=37863 RepID=A0A1I7YYN9_9BILA
MAFRFIYDLRRHRQVIHNVWIGSSWVPTGKATRCRFQDGFDGGFGSGLGPIGFGALILELWSTSLIFLVNLILTP